MFLSIDDNIIKKGFCFGRFEATIDATSRLRLNNSIVSVLQEHNISSLWRYADPTGKRFILCPPKHRPTYLKLAQKHLSESMESEEALRLFIFSGTEAYIDAQGRISILKCCLKNAEINPPQRVVILGVSLWFEVLAQ